MKTKKPLRIVVCGFALAIALFSCVEKHTQDEGTVYLNAFEVVALESSVLVKYPYRVNVCDGAFILLDLHAPLGYYLHVFSYPEVHFITPLCKIGEGPNEFISIRSFDVMEDSLFVIETTK